jgi:hypothetical protein
MSTAKTTIVRSKKEAIKLVRAVLLEQALADEDLVRRVLIQELYAAAKKARRCDDEVRRIAAVCEARTGRHLDADDLIAAIARGESWESVEARLCDGAKGARETT